LRDRRLVFITSPEGRTTVCRGEISIPRRKFTVCLPRSGTTHPLLCRSGPRWLLREGVISEWGTTVRIALTSGAASAKHATNSRRGARIELWAGVRTKNSGAPSALPRTGKNNGMPFSFKTSLISVHPTPGWQTRSESSSEKQTYSNQQRRSKRGPHHE
jgi:hypothetical protein